MSKEMDNHSFNETNSLSGNSGLLALTKTRLQPMRVQELLDLCTSDDEDSEDKGKDSDSEPDDIQQLSDDEEEAEQPHNFVEEPIGTLSPVEEENKSKGSFGSEVCSVSSARESALSNSEKLEEKHRFQLRRKNHQTPVCNSEINRFTDNFLSNERLQGKNISSASNIAPESVCAISQNSSSVTKHARSNRRSNVKFEMPDSSYSSEKLKFAKISVKSEAITCPFEVREPNERSKYTGTALAKSETIIYSAKIHGDRFEAPEPVKSEANIHSSKIHSDRPSSGKFEAPDPVKSEANIHSSKIHSDRPSNGKFEAPDPVKSQANIYSSKIHGNRPSSSKFEASEPTYYSNERHLHSASVAQSETSSSAGSALQPPIAPSHAIIDTPMKNNPPAGSSRPTTSVAHRSMFQTPQNSKLHQDYSKNRAQTPATIFGNWSQNHMVQTPLQSRSTTSDSARSQVPSILAQHGAGHEATPWYRNNDDKDRPKRTPLGEAIQSNIHSSEKQSVPYNLESSNSSKTHDSGDNQSRGIPLEKIKDVSAKKSAVLGTHESKENRLPQSIEKSMVKEETPRISRPPESIKELITTCSNEISNENLSEARSKVRSIKNSESQAPQNFRSSYSSRPNPPTPAANVAEKKNISERNVQSSIPSSIRRSNHSEIITVKGKEYLILGTLGAGMSGQVLRVQDLRTRDLRAIKIVNLVNMDKDCARGCLQEISMLHKLQAPCVVKMFDYEISYPIIHVVMEMGDTDFRSLLQSMSDQKKLPLTMILYYWTEMLTAVKHIHDNGVIHSDLKPANFLLVRGRLKLIDFGIASSMNPDMTSVVKSNQIGTVNYISPEALMDIGGNGGDSPNKVKYKITFKSDVWSLGCILYSLVYGHTPFQHMRTGWAKMHAITNPNPNISFALPTGSDAEPPPPILVDVMRKCLQHDPKARPTVAQLLQIPYVPTKQNAAIPSADIPSNVLLKIKHSLTESEWRQFIDIMEAKRNRC